MGWLNGYGGTSMRFSRQEYLSGLPCPPPGDLPNLGIKPAALMSNIHFPGAGGGVFITSTTWEAHPPGDQNRKKKKKEKKITSIGVDLKNLEPHTLLVGM